MRKLSGSQLGTLTRSSFSTVRPAISVVGPVVETGDVGARVVNLVGLRLREGAAGHEVAVADGAQRLPQPLAGGVKAVIGQRPDARRPLGVPLAQLRGHPPLLQASQGQRRQGDVVQGGHDQVGARPHQQVPVVKAGHPQRRHPAGLGRLDPAGGVLDHEAVAGVDAKLGGGGEEDGRVGLAPGEVAAGDVGVEHLLQGHPGADEAVLQPLLGGEEIEADPRQEQLGVLGRGGSRHPDPHALDDQDEPQRVGEGHEPALLDQLEDLLLLGRRVPLGPGAEVGHAEVLKGGAGAGHPGLARHDLLVHRWGEPLRRPAGLVADLAPLGFHQDPERLPPGQLVGRVHQHAVHVEDRTSVRHDPASLLLHSRGGPHSPGQRLDTALRGSQEGLIGHAEKEPVLHHAKRCLERP